MVKTGFRYELEVLGMITNRLLALYAIQLQLQLYETNMLYAAIFHNILYLILLSIFYSIVMLIKV